MALVDDMIAVIETKKNVSIDGYVINIGASGITSYGFDGHVLWTKDFRNNKVYLNLDNATMFNYIED